MGHGKIWIIRLLIIGGSLTELTACGVEGDHGGEVLAEDPVAALGKVDDLERPALSRHGISFTEGETRDLGRAEIDLAQYSPEILAEALEYTEAALPESGVIPAQDLLSSFAQTHALKYPPADGVNCWYTAIASVMNGFTAVRFMDSDEFVCQLRTGFASTTKPQFGDVVRLQTSSGSEVHGAVYIGVDDESGEVVLFTKNGMHKQTPFAFGTLKDLQTRVYKEAVKVTYYRPRTKLRDPQSESDPCFAEAEESRKQSALLEQGSEDPSWPIGGFGHLPPM